MPEKNILAYFKTPEEAENAQKKLSAMGVKELQIDRFSKYSGDGIEQYLNPITGNVSSLADLTQAIDTSSREAGVLMAADVASSGMSDGGQNSITGRDILLTAVVDESIHPQALQIVQGAGGML